MDGWRGECKNATQLLYSYSTFITRPAHIPEHAFRPSGPSHYRTMLADGRHSQAYSINRTQMSKETKRYPAGITESFDSEIPVCRSLFCFLLLLLGNRVDGALENGERRGVDVPKRGEEKRVEMRGRGAAGVSYGTEACPPAARSPGRPRAQPADSPEEVRKSQSDGILSEKAFTHSVLLLQVFSVPLVVPLPFTTSLWCPCLPGIRNRRRRTDDAACREEKKLLKMVGKPDGRLLA